jgi:hypothetical protein
MLTSLPSSLSILSIKWRGKLKEVTETRLGGKNSYIFAFWYRDEYKIVVAQFIGLGGQDVVKTLRAVHKSSLKIQMNNYIPEHVSSEKKLTG